MYDLTSAMMDHMTSLSDCKRRRKKAQENKRAQTKREAHLLIGLAMEDIDCSA